MASHERRLQMKAGLAQRLLAGATLRLVVARVAHPSKRQLCLTGKALPYVLRYRAPNGSRTYAHRLTDVLHAQALSFDHPDDFQLQADAERFTLSCHLVLLEWWIFHLSRCPGKFRPQHHARLLARQNFGGAVITTIGIHFQMLLAEYLVSLLGH